MSVVMVLLQYKRRQLTNGGWFVWGPGLFFLGAYILFVIGLFVSFYLVFQVLLFPEVAANFLLLFVGAWVANYNINGQPLGEDFAREFEYFATLPVPHWVIMAVELFNWFAKNLLLLSLFLPAPVIALALDDAAQVPSGVVALLALGLYCGWLILAGAWLRLHALRGQGWITTLARLLTLVILFLGVFLFPVSNLPAQFVAAQGLILQVCSWPIWPNVWAVRVAYGQEIFWLPLVGLTALTAWRTLPRLMRFWEERPVSKARRSRYPFRLLTGSGWAFAKYVGVCLLVEPSTQFIARFFTLVPMLVLWLYFFHANAQALWLLALVLISWLLGAPAYILVQKSAERLDTAGLPLTTNDILRGAGSILGMIYAPTLGVVACFIGIVAEWTPGLLMAWLGSLAGIAFLAWSARRHVPVFWAFLVPALLEVGLSFLT